MATFTITTPAGEDARILAAFGKRLGLPGSATGAQVKQQLVQVIINTVQEQESSVAIQTAVAAVVPVNPT